MRAQVYVPMLDGRPLVNVTGSDEREAWVNLDTYTDLPENDRLRVRVVPATLVIEEHQDV